MPQEYQEILSAYSQLGRPVHGKKHSFEVEEKVSFEYFQDFQTRTEEVGKRKTQKG
jgi:hypothetical protein